ncbi:MAG: hypothetical protein Q8M47_08830 [Devosia sp.]|nr:hypothetical protein [Devosia sp.]
MNSSSNLLHKFAQTGASGNDPGFWAIVAFDYYDGPERGIAIYPSGEGVRFSSFGDSKSRLFRAFELVPISGDWRPEVKALEQAASVESSSRVLVPAVSSDILQRFEDAVFSAAATGLYVGVGSPNFGWMYVSAVTDEQIDRLRQQRAPDAFQSVHSLIKASPPAVGSIQYRR